MKKTYLTTFFYDLEIENIKKASARYEKLNQNGFDGMVLRMKRNFPKPLIY